MPMATRKELWASPLVGDHVFDEELWRGYKEMSTLVSTKKPKQNPQTNGRGGGNKGKGNILGNLPKRERPRSQRVGTSLTLDTGLHEGTRGAHITATSFRPIIQKITDKLSNFAVAWSEIGADPWVMRIVQWGYKIPFVMPAPTDEPGK